MSTNLNQYTKILGKYNTTLKEYREALQRGDSYTTNQKYNDLIKLSGELKTEFVKVKPYLQEIKNEHDKLKNANDNAYDEWAILEKQYMKTGSRSDYQKINDAKEVSRKASSELESFEKEFKPHEFRAEIINEVNRLQAEDITIRIHYNETRSEGDLISKEQRQQDKEVYDEIRTIIDQTYSLSEMTSSRNVKQETKVVENYTGHLNDSELSAVVLDDHMFYRLITSKQYQYTSEQYNKIFYEVSENLAKEPMTVAEIIGFCRENGIPHFSDDEFRSLIKNEDKDYEDTSRSVRDVADYNYIPKDSEMTASHQTPDSHSRGNVKTTTIVDADSFYKFIDTKMVRGEYTNEQYNKLYVGISEVLVHSPLTKSEIDEIYYKHNITPPTEIEFGRLIERQESRRETDYISKNSGGLEFKGGVDIDIKDQNFKIKVDLYHNKGQTESEEMEGIFLETAKAYNESFGIRKSGDVANFRVFIYDNAKAYTEATGRDPRGHATFSDNGNTANVYLFFGDNNYQNDDDLLCHEFAHALTLHSTSKLGLSPMFMEGIAEYTVGKMHGKSNADFVKLIPPRNFNKSLRELINDPECESDHYITGAAIVAFLEEEDPNFLDNYLHAANDAIKNDKHVDVMEMREKFLQKYGDKPLREIEWFKSHFNYDADDAHTGHPDHRSEGGYSGPPVQVKPLDKQDNNAIQPEAQKPIVLNFIIERGEPIGEYYFSARIKLTEESKNFLREALGQDVEFNNVDGYLDLDPKTFYIGNGHNNRNELYVRDSGGSVLVGNLPVDNRVLSVEVSPDGSEIVDHGFHYSAVIRNPDSYSKDYKEQNKYPSGLDSDKFLEDVKNTLLSHNGNDIEQKNIFTQVSNNIAEKEDRAVEEQKQVEKEFSKKNVEFKNAIDKGDIVIYRVREKANPDDDERSFAILKMTKKSQKALGIRDEDDKGVKLDTNKLHITELQDSSHKGKYMVKDGIDHVPYNNLFYVLDKNDPSKSGFYHLDQDKFKSPAKYLDAKLQYISDDGLHNKLISNLDKVGQKYAYYNEQMQGDQPQASHKVDKHHAKHEDIVLKDTILSVGKGEEVTLPNGQKIYKAEIKIKYEDIKSLYDQASSEEKQYVLKFWHALDKNNYKIGDLSQEQYYFKGNKFIIKNKNGIELSRDEGKISLQLMHLKDHQGKDHLELVVLNKANGKVIGNIHEIDDLSYGLLRSDSDILSHLEIQGHDITVHSSDYNTYLTHGLDNHVLGNHHHGDHTFI